MEQKAIVSGVEPPRLPTESVNSQGLAADSDSGSHSCSDVPGDSDLHQGSEITQDSVADGQLLHRVTLPVLKIPFVKDEPSALWLRRADQGVIAIFLIIGTSLLFLNWLRLSRWGAEPVEIERLPDRRVEYRININRATKYELAELDGIGPVLAGRIVDNRDLNGPFSSSEDLLRVHGIGQKTLEKLKPHLEVAEEAAVSAPTKKPTRRKR